MTGSHILIAYASKHGSTREVAETVAARLRDHGAEVDVLAVDDVGHDLTTYDAVVLGGALYTGRLLEAARQFLARHGDALVTRPVAVFALGPRTLERADVAGSRAQLDRALAAVPGVTPVAVAIFGGVVKPDELHFPFNRMPPGDARDWDTIRAWADELPTG